MEVNVLNLGMTRLTQSYNGVHHWHGTTRNAVIVQSFGGVFARLRNAYYHDIQERWFLLDSAQPAWMERINLDGTVETFFAPPTNDDAVEPTFTRVTLSESTKLSIFTQLEVTSPVDEPPLVIASTVWVENLNADRVDSLHATLLPEANTLLALDNNSKWPNSTLYMGHTFGIDADTVDGKHFTDIQAEIDTKTAWWVSPWTTVTAPGTFDFVHNLNKMFNEIVIHCRPGTSGDATAVLPTNFYIPYVDNSRDGSLRVKTYNKDLNTVTVALTQSGTGSNGTIGYNATGALITSGQYRVLGR